MSMVTDNEGAFSGDEMKLVGYDMSAAAARKAMEQAGVKAEDVDVCELHDCFSANELVRGGREGRASVIVRTTE